MAAWEITFEKEDGEKVVVNLDDLAPEIFEEIAKGSDLSFWGVQRLPTSHPDMLHRVLVAAAQHAGIEPPPKAETMRAIREQAGMFSEVPDAGELPVVGDFPQEPGTPESGSSSGVPGDSDGQETNPSDNP